MGGGARGYHAWGGHHNGHGWLGLRSWYRAQKAREAMLDAAEGMMRQDGITPPERPVSQITVAAWAFAAGLFLGLLIGLVVWELT